MKKTVLIISLIALCAGSAFSQQTASTDSTLREIERLYNAARYSDAELEARRLREETVTGDSVKVQIEKWIAFSLIAQGKSSIARERFIMALTIDPDFDLDPVLTSPKILTVFNDAKAKYLSVIRLQPDTAQSPGLRRHTPISYRTVLFPGWEQLHRERTTVGAVFLGAGIATLGAGLALEFLRSDARDSYLKATLPADIASKYDSYNTYRKAETYSFIAFAVVYIASQVDIFTESTHLSAGGEAKNGPSGGPSLTISVAF